MEVGVELFVEFVCVGFAEVLVRVVEVIVLGVLVVAQEAVVYPVEKVFEQIVCRSRGVHEIDARCVSDLHCTVGSSLTLGLPSHTVLLHMA